MKKVTVRQSVLPLTRVIYSSHLRTTYSLTDFLSVYPAVTLNGGFTFRAVETQSRVLVDLFCRCSWRILLVVVTIRPGLTWAFLTKVRESY